MAQVFRVRFLSMESIFPQLNFSIFDITCFYTRSLKQNFVETRVYEINRRTWFCHPSFIEKLSLLRKKLFSQTFFVIKVTR